MVQKIRIFALAKELGMDSKVLIKELHNIGIDVHASALASISPDEQAFFRNSFGRTAAERIENAIKRKSRVLGLGGLGLSTIPLQIRDGHFTAVFLGGNEFEELDDQSLELLSSCASIDLRNNRLRALPTTIGILERVGHINLTNNQLQELPANFGRLTNLSYLDLSANLITSLPETIGQLSKLQTLILAGNRLERLPRSIANLKDLRSLRLGDFGRGNPVVDLPVELRKLPKLVDLNVSSCPRLKLPPEIVDKRGTPHEILDYYFRSHNQPAQPLNEAKVLVVGEAEVGKTSLIKQLLELGDFDPGESQTHGIVTHHSFFNKKTGAFPSHPSAVSIWSKTKGKIGQKNIESIKDVNYVRLNVWDFGGQEIMHATHQFFLTKRSLYLLVLDSRQNERQSRIEYWLKLIHSFGADSPVVVVCNKCDQQQMELDWPGLQKKYPQIKAFVGRVSCYHDNVTGKNHSEGLDKVRKTITEQIAKLEHVDSVFPQAWFDVKQNLEDMSDSFKPYADYEELCTSNGIADESEQRQLIGFLHDLGIVLHFHDHPILRDTNVLNPLWVTNAVYRILNCPKLKDELHGVLDFSHLPVLLKSVENDRFQYPQGQREFLIEVMRRFELLFDFEGRTDRFLVPNLLPLEARDSGDWSDSLAFQYRYDVLPGSVISRFIVRMHRRISQQKWWRKGVVLASRDGRNRALVKADAEEGRIDIRIDGPVRGRRAFLASIRDQFDSIHDTIHGLGVVEWVPLPQNPDVAIRYERLHKMEQRQIGQEYVDEIDDYIRVRELLDGVDEQEFDLFLSHNSKDKDEVRRLRDLLRGHGVRCWLDEDDIRLGKRWAPEVADALVDCRAIAVLIGPNGSGPWQAMEFRDALQQAAQNDKPVFPIVLPAGDDSDQSLPSEFRFLKQWTRINLSGGFDDAAISKLAQAVHEAVSG